MSTRILLVVACFLAGPRQGRAEDSPEAILKRAIKAHGGADKLAKTLTGTLRAKAKGDLPPGGPFTIEWQETFELPRRYKRVIDGGFNGRPLHMEYAVTDGSGWVRQDKGEVKEFKGQKLPLEASWNSRLALLPSLLGKEYKRSLAGKETLDGKEAVGIKLSGGQGETVLYFDTASGLLVKSKSRTQHPLTGKETAFEGRFRNYKNTAGVRYPGSVVGYADGKKILEMEITEIKFLDRVEDKAFEKP